MRTAFIYQPELLDFHPDACPSVDDDSGVKVQPDLSYSCREIVSRFSRGLPVPSLGGVYDPEDSEDSAILGDSGDGLLDYIDRYNSLSADARSRYASERAAYLDSLKQTGEVIEDKEKE